MIEIELGETSPEFATIGSTGSHEDKFLRGLDIVISTVALVTQYGRCVVRVVIDEIFV